MNKETVETNSLVEVEMFILKYEFSSLLNHGRRREKKSTRVFARLATGEGRGHVAPTWMVHRKSFCSSRGSVPAFCNFIFGCLAFQLMRCKPNRFRSWSRCRANPSYIWSIDCLQNQSTRATVSPLSTVAPPCDLSTPSVCVHRRSGEHGSKTSHLCDPRSGEDE